MKEYEQYKKRFNSLLRSILSDFKFPKVTCLLAWMIYSCLCCNFIKYFALVETFRRHAYRQHNWLTCLIFCDMQIAT